MLNKAFDIYFFFFFSSKKTQTADTSSVDEALILVGTNFVTGPVTLIQNYSLLKLVIIQSSMHLRQIQKIPNWQQFYILQVKMCSTLFHRFPCCTWSGPKTSLCTVTEMILCRGISGLHWSTKTLTMTFTTSFFARELDPREGNPKGNRFCTGREKEHLRCAFCFAMYAESGKLKVCHSFV